MIRKLMFLLATVVVVASCSDDDEKIPRDYSMQTFSADMKYEPAGGGGMAKDFTYKQQTYMKLGKTDAVAAGTYGQDSWTTFNVLKKVPNDSGDLVENKDYNVTTTVKNWDLLFTQYVGNAMKGKGQGVMPYFLTGVLINPEQVQVGLITYEDSKEPVSIRKAFSDLSLEGVADVKYSTEIDYIGIAWKGMSGMPPTYSPKANNFYIVKTKSGDIYKLRFVGIYGKDKSETIFTCEYALIK